ncbi:MAG: hypothetical protein WBG88_06280 [Mesorhizobium sp.]
MKIRLVLVSGLLAISGCATTGSGGGAGKPVSSALSLPGNSDGTKIAKAIVAEMGGGLVGGKIGAGLTEREKRSGLEAEYKALEYTASGQVVTWKSDSSNRYGEVVAAQPYRVGSQDCRQYTHTVYAGGAGVSARGTACRNSDGSWTPLT